MSHESATPTRISIDQVRSVLADCTEHTWVVPNTTMTVAAVVNPNGFVLGIGTSSCISREEFDADVGAQLAKKNARAEAESTVWASEGYVLARSLGIV